MTEFFGNIFSLTRTLVGLLVLLVILVILRAAGLLDEAGAAMIQLILLPVKLVNFLIDTIGPALKNG